MRLHDRYPVVNLLQNVVSGLWHTLISEITAAVLHDTEHALDIVLCSAQYDMPLAQIVACTRRWSWALVYGKKICSGNLICSC